MSSGDVAGGFADRGHGRFPRRGHDRERCGECDDDGERVEVIGGSRRGAMSTITGKMYFYVSRTGKQLLHVQLAIAKRSLRF